LDANSYQSGSVFKANQQLDEFLQKLSNQVPKLSVSTLGAYMGLTRCHFSA
jgi:hypothetical protein